jgi:hypothetical protein
MALAAAFNALQPRSAQALYSPSVTSGLIGFWDPSDPASRIVVLNSLGASAISQLNDKSGQNNHLTNSYDPGNNDALPILTAINGRQSLYWDNGLGTADLVLATAIAMGSTNSRAVFAVVRLDSDAIGQWFGGNTTGTACGRGGTVGDNRLGGMSAQEAAHSYVLGVQQLRSLIKTSNTSLVARKNGVQVASASSGAGTSNLTEFGNGALEGQWIGSTGVILVYNRAPSAGEIATIESELMAWAGL